jgi:outer membrane protein
MNTKLFLGCLAGALSLAGAASAQDLGMGPGVGKEAGAIMVRARVIDVSPISDHSSTSIGGSVDVTDTVAPEVDFSYFFTDHIAAELIAATTQHKLTAKNTALGNIDVGKTMVLPPSLTLQYHFFPHSAISPYLGAGINYTVFYDTKLSNQLQQAGLHSLALESNWGTVVQAGVDWNITGHWFANLDIKQIFVNTKAKIQKGAVTAKTQLDPTVYGIGIGYRF